MPDRTMMQRFFILILSVGLILGIGFWFTASAHADEPHAVSRRGLVGVLKTTKQPALQEVLRGTTSSRTLNAELSQFNRVRGHFAYVRRQRVRDARIDHGGVDAVMASATAASSAERRYERRVGADPVSSATPKLTTRLAADAWDNAAADRLLAGAFRMALVKIDRCYDRSLMRDPSRRGTVLLHLVVNPDGFVSAATVRRDGVGDHRLRSCITQAFEQVRTARPMNDRFLVEIPLLFESARAQVGQDARK